MTLATNVSADDDLDTLLMGLGLSEVEINPLAAEESILGETALEAAVMGAEAQEAIEDHYNSAESTPEEIEAVVDPLTDPSSLITASAPVVEKKAAKKEPKEPKEKKAPAVRKHYASKVERVSDKLGADLGNYTVLELADASLSGDELAAKQAETIEAMKGASVKVSGRMAYLMEFAAGKTASLNNIAVTALTLLKNEGKIITGETGNLHLELAKKYSRGSANSMANSTLGALRTLKMIQGEKGEYVLNPNSLYAMKILPMLGL